MANVLPALMMIDLMVNTSVCDEYVSTTECIDPTILVIPLFLLFSSPVCCYSMAFKHLYHFWFFPRFFSIGEDLYSVPVL